MRIAILDDEPEQLQLVEHALQGMEDWSEHHVCHTFTSGAALLRAIRQGETFDLLLLDWMVPDVDGATILQWVRNYHPEHVPVVMLTSRDAEADVVQLLSAGADDYVVKPFRARELVARIKVVMRRVRALPQGAAAQTWRFGNLELDEGTLTATHANGEQTVLTAMEFRLATLLFRNVGRPLSRAYVVESVWGAQSDVSRRLDTHISNLRRKLRLTASEGWQLLTVYGHGYRLERVGESTGAPQTGTAIDMTRTSGPRGDDDGTHN